MINIINASRNRSLRRDKIVLSVIVIFGYYFSDCLTIRTNFQPLDQLRGSVTKKDSSYDHYLLTSGEWLANQPIMVNRDYDFAIAQAIEGSGPGIAANKRTTGNKDVAGKLTSIATVEWKATFDKQVQECGGSCKNLNGSTVRFYGLLYGDDKARLQSILEIEKANESRSKATKSVYRFVEVSEERSLEGDSSWLSNHGQLILDRMKSSISKLVDLSKQYLRLVAADKAPNAKVGECPIGGTYHAKGGVIKEDERQTVILVENMPRTILSCDKLISN